MQLTTMFFLLAGSTLAVTHLLALQFYLYWRYLWFDMPMHYLGGITVGFLLYVLYDLGIKAIPRRPRWFTVLIWTLMIAMLWEIFEVIIHAPMDENYLLDTVVDLILGGAGGLTAYYISNSVTQTEV